MENKANEVFNFKENIKVLEGFISKNLLMMHIVYAGIFWYLWTHSEKLFLKIVAILIGIYFSGYYFGDKELLLNQKLKQYFSRLMMIDYKKQVQTIYSRSVESVDTQNVEKDQKLNNRSKLLIFQAKYFVGISLVILYGMFADNFLGLPEYYSEIASTELSLYGILMEINRSFSYGNAFSSYMTSSMESQMQMARMLIYVFIALPIVSLILFLINNHLSQILAKVGTILEAIILMGAVTFGSNQISSLIGGHENILELILRFGSLRLYCVFFGILTLAGLSFINLLIEQKTLLQPVVDKLSNLKNK